MAELIRDILWSKQNSALHKIWPKQSATNSRTVNTVISLLHNRWNTMQLNRALLLPSCWWVLDLIMQLAGEEAGNRARVTRVTACKWRIWDYSRSGETSIQEKLGEHCVGSSGMGRAALISVGIHSAPFPKGPYLCPCDKPHTVSCRHLELEKYLKPKQEASRTSSLHGVKNPQQQTNDRLVDVENTSGDMKFICNLH